MRDSQFEPLPSDNMIVFEYPGGELRINQRYLETAMPLYKRKKFDRLIKKANTPFAFQRR